MTSSRSVGTTSPEELPEGAYLAALASLERMGPARLRKVIAVGPPSRTWASFARGAAPGALGSQREPDRGDHHQDSPDAGSSIAAELLSAWIRAVGRDPGVPSRMQVRLERLGVRVCSGEDLGDRLAGDPSPPAVLFSRGSGLVPGRARVAVVGTRRASRYGLRVAHDLGRGLTASGVGVVSGLALGIDAAAHAGAMEVLGPGGRAAGGSGGERPAPVAVIGAGHDRPCPSRNRALARSVVGHGCLLGEVPPGTPSAPWRYPVRNRLIAALADVVVVVESALGGGSMSTVAEALRRDRPVMAVPGQLGTPSSDGCHQLIRDGAHICTGVDDVVGMLGLLGASSAPPVEAVGADSGDLPGASRVDLPPEDAILLDQLAEGPCDPGTLAARSGLGLPAVASALVRLEGAGLVIRSGGFVDRR